MSVPSLHATRFRRNFALSRSNPMLTWSAARLSEIWGRVWGVRLCAEIWLQLWNALSDSCSTSLPCIADVPVILLLKSSPKVFIERRGTVIEWV